MPRVRRLLTAAAFLAFPLLCHTAVERGNALAAGFGIALPLAVNLALCALFGRTLATGREPMIARFARLQRGAELPPDLASYARTLTVLWTWFFASMAAISLGLAIWGSTLAWSLFTNVVNYLLVAAFFVGEYVYRRVRFKHYRHPSPIEVARGLHLYRP
ncbi:MAG TPA: hypothetical protein VGO02_04350 [Burkholderiales bacterium]|jgi:uncharacterized membrane protein|nr:hypothetical protein [Burkholderiales bacterium]